MKLRLDMTIAFAYMSQAAELTMVRKYSAGLLVVEDSSFQVDL